MGLPLKALRPNDGQGVLTAFVARAMRMHGVGAKDIPAQWEAIPSAAWTGLTAIRRGVPHVHQPPR